MKSITKYVLIVFSLVILFFFSPKFSHAQEPIVNYQVFYDDLSPYGDWVNYPGYGFVWIPYAGPEFEPYATRGYWAYTEFGWTWVSDYNWGWAPFHYGRWQYDSYYGWIWVPGDEWAPAWVVWRRSPGYYGWAPLGPGISVNIVIGGTYQPPAEHWIFVDEHYIGQKDIHNYYGPRKNNGQYINNSNIINNTYVDHSRNTTYIAGPDKNEVQKVRGKNIEPVSIKENSTHSQEVKDNQLRIFRPAITKQEGAKPSRVVDKNDVKKPAERKTIIQPSNDAPNQNNGPVKKNNRIDEQKPVEAKPIPNSRPIDKKTPEENKQQPVPKRNDPQIKENKAEEVKPVVPDNTKIQTPKPEQKIPQEKPRPTVQPEKQQAPAPEVRPEKPKEVQQPIQHEQHAEPIQHEQEAPKVQPKEHNEQQTPQPMPQPKAEPRPIPTPQPVPRNQQPAPKSAPQQPRHPGPKQN